LDFSTASTYARKPSVEIWTRLLVRLATSCIKAFAVWASRLPHLNAGTQLRFHIHSAERPNATVTRVIVNAHMFFFLDYESPNLIELQQAAIQIAHLLIHQRNAALANTDA